MDTKIVKTLIITAAIIFIFNKSYAATIIVDGTNGAVDNNDGVCSISEAIIAANTDAVSNECIAGVGDDTIELTQDVILNQAYEINSFGRTGTPAISSTVILDGNGFILQRDSTLTCNLNSTGTTGEFRILRNNNGNLILKNITIAHGCADSSINANNAKNGGGIFNIGTLSVIDTTFDQSQAQYSGGAISHNGAIIVEISRCTFLENSSNQGGSVYNQSTITTIQNNTFSGNSSTTGGAIHNISIIKTIQNNTFSGNSTNAFGGAIYNSLGEITNILNNTFSGNSASLIGGAIFNDFLGRIATLQNSVFHNNGNNECINDYIFNGINNISTSSNSGCPGILGTQLTANTLGALADNGGSTMTHALLAGSEALNIAVNGTTTDQRGFANDFNRDIGAFEAQVPVVTAPADNTFEATGALSSPTLGVATVVDVDEIGLSAIPNPSSFALGTHTVTWTATDSQGFVDSDTQQVTIVDTTAPVITPPVDIVMEATGLTTPVTLGTATANDLVDGVIIPTANMSSPFGVGTHTITWSATDVAGNTGTATQMVTITDTTAPIVIAPADIVIESTGVTTTVILGTATAVDIVNGNVTPVTADMSNPFTLAMHTITWSATDNAGNTGTATQLVNVQAVISGTVSGLTGSLTLQNNGGDDLVLTANGGFRFITALDNVSPYAITVLNQPSTQTCEPSNAGGQVNGNNISDIVVTCTDNTVSLDTSSLDFGLVYIYENDTQTVTITNTGLGSVFIDSFTNPSSPFSIIGGSCVAVPVTLLSTQSCDFNIQFKPRFEGDFTDSFMVNSNTINSPNSITLAGSSAIRIIPVFSRFGLIVLLLLFLILATHHFKSIHRDIS
jgi:hypothetical protein